MIYINSGIFPVAVTTQSACHFRRFTSHSRPPSPSSTTRTHRCPQFYSGGTAQPSCAPTLSDCYSTPMEVGCYRQFALSNFSCVTYRVPDSAGDTFSLQLQHGPNHLVALFSASMFAGRADFLLFSSSIIPLLCATPQPVRASLRLYFLLFHSSLSATHSFSLPHRQYISSSYFSHPSSLVSNFHFLLLRDILRHASFHLANSLIFTASLSLRLLFSSSLISASASSLSFVYFFRVFVAPFLRIYSRNWQEIVTNSRLARSFTLFPESFNNPGDRRFPLAVSTPVL